MILYGGGGAAAAEAQWCGGVAIRLMQTTLGNLVLLFDHQLKPVSSQIAGRYIPAMAVNRRYITAEVGWLVWLRDYERSA